MKNTRICLVFSSAFIFAALLSSCSFLQKGEFAQRKYYDFPRTKHAETQPTSATAQNKSIPLMNFIDAEKPTSPEPLVSASVNKNEIISLKKTVIPHAVKPIRKIARPGKGTVERIESPGISFRKSDIQKEAIKNTRFFPSTDPDVMLVILVVLAIFIPPLAIYLKDNATNKWFWITLILCIFGGGFIFGGIGYGFGLLWFTAIVIAILDVLDRL
jgi:uncharacterized membrane protein YqaE (UPF0057 family)